MAKHAVYKQTEQQADEEAKLERASIHNAALEEAAKIIKGLRMKLLRVSHIPSKDEVDDILAEGEHAIRALQTEGLR